MVHSIPMAKIVVSMHDTQYARHYLSFGIRKKIYIYVIRQLSMRLGAAQALLIVTSNQ